MQTEQGGEAAGISNRRLFLEHLGQTSEAPMALEIVRAEGSTLWDAGGREYIDLIGGISVCNVGHRHPAVVAAIQKQLDEYLHIMVYGELVQSPQVQYAALLAAHLPASLNSVFFTASGTEATEGAMKLAKRYTGRTEIVAFRNSYHGSTQGALSLMGDEYWRNAFRPLLPAVQHLPYNSFEELDRITRATACVVAETIQAEAGVIVPADGWLQALRKRCDKTGALLVLDEIQCGFGRNGSLWAFESFNVVPDILLLGKALGGGMPLGAFVSDKRIMHHLTHQPVLGHINTFGGHPVCCAAGMAAMKVLLEEGLIDTVKEKESLFKKLLQHPALQLRSRGLMIAIEFSSEEINRRVIRHLLEPTDGRAVFTDWFLFAPQCLRIAPPLTISTREIEQSCQLILQAVEKL